jgi:dihydroorotate dehydrogenase (fumarate)
MMMELTTTYMGIPLRSPLVPSASPLSEKVDNIRRMEEAGAGAVVLHSLFEEQLAIERIAFHHYLETHNDTFYEAAGFFPRPPKFHVGPDAYLEHIRRAKELVDIPLIASLNCTSVGSWIEYAKEIEQAGADGLELNIFYIPTDLNLAPGEVEQQYVEIVRAVMSCVELPVAVKLSPFFSNLAYTANRLDAEGVAALVLFNRFYQPDIDLRTREVHPHLTLSTSESMRLPLRWIALLYGKVRAEFAASGGVHNGRDAIKLIMAGASVAMLCSALLRHGIEHLSVIEQEMLDWMEEYEYESVEEMQGCMSYRNVSDPSSFERAHYVRGLQSYRLAATTR